MSLTFADYDRAIVGYGFLADFIARIGKSHPDITLIYNVKTSELVITDSIILQLLNQYNIPYQIRNAEQVLVLIRECGE